MLRSLTAAVCLLAVLGGGVALAQGVPEVAEPDRRIRLEVGQVEAAVGDRIETTLVLQLGPAETFLPPEIGPQWGPFEVLDGEWSESAPDGRARTWIWKGGLAVYRVGTFTIPEKKIEFGVDPDRGSLRTEPMEIVIESVLEATETEPDSPEAPALSDLKGQVSIPADFHALVWAGSILLLLLAASGAIWWLHRRYAAGLAAVETPTGLFDRIPPHQWVYAELQQLLERRLPEQGEIDVFYAELSRIVRRYLGGRYRVELMERTTAEIPDRLLQAGAPREILGAVQGVMEQCDAVKFAAVRPGSDAWKSVVEEIYRIVDTTKPQTAASERGAA